MALLSKTAPSGVSSTGIYNIKFSVTDEKSNPGKCNQPYYSKIGHTFPIGFIFKNSGVLFDTPIWKSLASSTFTPEYSAAMSAFQALLFPFPACKIWKQNTSLQLQKVLHTCHTSLICQYTNHLLCLLSKKKKNHLLCLKLTHNHPKGFH